MIQTGHSGESRARSEALALSSNLNMHWMPDQVRHDDPGTFYETINIHFLDIEYWNLRFICNLVLVIWNLTSFILKNAFLLCQPEYFKLHMERNT